MIDLRLGDCLEVLPTLADASVNSVVTDPPYGQTNESYDGPIAFDPALWRECYRIAGPNAALISFAGLPTYHRIASAIEAGGWRVRQMWGWVYRDGVIASAWPQEGFDRLAPAMDPIVYATKGKVLLNLAREGPAWSKSSRSNVSLMSGRFRNSSSLQATGHWPKSIVSDGCEPFEYFMGSRQVSRKDVKVDHPNQKPLDVLRWLVSKLPPGGIVLDPFMGSGTTGVAALQLGFSFIGVECNPAYHAIAHQRIDAT